MASAKVRGLLFEAWWRERVMAERGAHVALGDLFADYRAHCRGAGMSLRAFEDRLRGLNVRVTARRGIRNCPGMRLRTEEEMEALHAGNGASVSGGTTRTRDGREDRPVKANAPALATEDFQAGLTRAQAQMDDIAARIDAMAAPADAPPAPLPDVSEFRGCLPGDVLRVTSREWRGRIEFWDRVCILNQKLQPDHVAPAGATRWRHVGLDADTKIEVVQFRHRDAMAAPTSDIDTVEVRIAVPPPRAPLFRLSPIVPGSGETSLGLMLEIAGPEDEASARVAEEVFAERRRQRAPKETGGEAWTAAHDDDAHRAGELEGAASAYAYAASLRDDHAPFLDLSAKRPRPPIRTGWLVVDFLWQVWPWSPAWWKPDLDAPGWRRRCLVKAGALILAAIEKLDRQAARDALSADERKQATGV